MATHLRPRAVTARSACPTRCDLGDNSTHKSAGRKKPVATELPATPLAQPASPNETVTIKKLAKNCAGVTVITHTDQKVTPFPLTIMPTSITQDIDRLDQAVAGKPIYQTRSRILNLKSAFAEKKLCDGLTFSAGTACLYQCSFCYVESMMARSTDVLRILLDAKRPFSQVGIRRRDALATLKKELLTAKGKPRFKEDTRTIYGSPLVDVAATVELANETVQLIKLMLEHTQWTIRLLSKGALLTTTVAKQLPAAAKNRVIYGFSTGTVDNKLSAAFEIGTAKPSKRIEALHRLQNEGYRTYGMACPSLPQRNYNEFAESIVNALRLDKCEHIWAEVLNVRGESLARTSQYLRNANYDFEATQLEQVATNGAAWEAYARNTFLAYKRYVPAQKLRFLQYVQPEHLQWWKEQEPFGAVLLGSAANTPRQADAAV